MHAQIFSMHVTRKLVRGVTSAMGFGALVGAFAGCAPQFQTQLIGQTTILAGAPGAGPAAVAEIPVPESRSA